MDIIVFIIILSVLVIIHELGHFLVARKYGVKVEEFGVGYPPRARVLKTDKRGTVYSLNWLPIGGFVRLFGEEGAETGSEAFCNQPVKQRMGIISAGVLVNFLFGVVVFASLYTYLGVSDGLPKDLGLVKIEEVAAGSPAQEAGLVSGDKVVGVISETMNQKIVKSQDFIQTVGSKAGSVITLKLKEPDREVRIYVRTKEETPEGQGAIGVVINDYEMVKYPLWQMPFRGVLVGLNSALELGYMIIKSLGQMVGNLFTLGQLPKDVAGPVGIAYMATKEKMLSQGWVALLNFTAMLSINLAIINILPIPPLDGGRAVMLLYEGVTRKKVNQELERRVLTVGMMFFLGLILLITIKDVGQVFQDSKVREWLMGLIQ